MNWNQIWDKVVDVLTTGGLTILKVLGIFVLGYIAIRIIKKIILKITTRAKMDKIAQKFLVNAIVYVLYFMLALMLIQGAGISITGLVAAMAAAGVAIALALQDVLASVVNGIVLVLVKPFKAGDSVNIGDVSGQVVSVNFFNTVIDTWDNKRVIIPNKNMIGYTIENEYYHEKRRNSFQFKVAHTTDMDKLEKILIDTVCANPRVYTDPMPSIVFKEISESGILLELRFWVVSEEFAGVGNQVMQAVYNQLKKNNVDLSGDRIIVYNEERNKNVWYNETPLAERDRNIQPSSNREKDMNFDDYVDSLRFKSRERIKKTKSKKAKKVEEKQVDLVEKKPSDINKDEVVEEKPVEEPKTE